MTILLPLTLGLVVVVSWLWKIGSREAGLPPGPPTVPLLGNLHVFPQHSFHYKFTEWARHYGGIYSLKLGPDTIVILTDVAAVKELIEKRSGSTADRPPMYVAELVTGGLQMVLARYSDKWRSLRRTAHATLTPKASLRHIPIQKAEATQLLHDILHDPEGFFRHIHRAANSSIMSVLYGKRSPRYETQQTAAFYKMFHVWEEITAPGATPPIDIIPILKYIPERFAKWKQICAQTRRNQRDLYFGFLDETRRRIQSGCENGSYMEEVLKRQEELGMDTEMAGYLGGALIEAGSDTTALYLKSLILALVAYPDAQQKAQEEIDRVVGEHRMPTLEDLEAMPYIRAVILETHRFRPTPPLMVPHRALNDEEYKGFLIPKGCTIFINAWGIFHDPMLFDDPERFMPERYVLTVNGTKPELEMDASDLRPNFVFGVGRRSCPGIHVAQHAININVMFLIWAFNFSTANDAEGNPISVDTFKYEKGIVTGPSPFKCKITPRSAEKAELIESEFLESGETFSKFEYGLDRVDKEFVEKTRAASSR
ncbi:putative cytochrome P450 [Favolaschia claudopus]|uniref:Cytochrome P450 n=1 Tax=Favolaschia claudopus TaxID=2862362 RepID=A0AAW0DJM9_9AGAR